MSGNRVAGNRLIGAPLERFEDLRFLRGRGTFVGDLERPGMLHAVVLRSSVAHGRLRSLDTSAAVRMPGVQAVITALEVMDEQPGIGGSGAPAIGSVECDARVPRIPIRLDSSPAYKPFEQPVIAAAKVRYVGEPIVLVVADSAAQAEDALEAIAVDIEPLPAVVVAEAAVAGGASLVEGLGNSPSTVVGVKGDVDVAFAGAPYTRRERFAVHRHSAVPLEPRGLLAEWDVARGHLTVRGAAKVVYHNRATLARLMGLEEARVDLVEHDVGGGFGVRGEFYPEDFLIPFAARMLGRPVRWIEDRREHLIACNHARDAACEIEIACERDGRIRGLRARSLVDMGAYVRTTGPTAPRNIAQVLSGPYRIEHVRSEVVLAVTNKTPSGTYRGPGRFEADFFRERLLDIVARDLGIDRVELRRRNLVRQSDQPWPMPTVLPNKVLSECDSGDNVVTLERCLEEFGWAEKSRRSGQVVDGRYRGIAIGCYVEGAGSGKESARLCVEPDGRIAVHVGSSGIGQGIETIFRQIAGDLLELPLERIGEVRHGSTGLVTEGVGSFSSRSTVMAGSAIAMAAVELKAALRKAAGRRLGCEAEHVEVGDGIAVAPGGKRATFAELAADVAPADATYANPKRTYSYGAHAVEVAVDPGTGAVSVLDYMAVEDVGRIVNPATLHGQCLGAIVQGLGGTLLEHLRYDEHGQMLAGSLADYLLPTATDFPAISVHALEQFPSPTNPLGAKGAGEGGIIPVGALIANAVADALAPLGVEPRALPLSPASVWALIAARGQNRG